LAFLHAVLANRSQLFSQASYPDISSGLAPATSRACVFFNVANRACSQIFPRTFPRAFLCIMKRFFVVIMHARNPKRTRDPGSPSGRRRLAIPQRGSQGAADGCTLTAIRERVYSQTFLHATLTTIKRNTQGRSAGGLCSAKAPPAKSAGLRCMHEKRQPLRGTYLPLRLPVRPSVRPSVPFIRPVCPFECNECQDWPSLGHAARPSVIC